MLPGGSKSATRSITSRLTSAGAYTGSLSKPPPASTSVTSFRTSRKSSRSSKQSARDFLHKTANRYIQNYQTIKVESLKINNMVRNRYLSKSISDASWGTFFELLTCKAEEAGRTVIKVNPKDTSQLCSGCGERVPKELSERTHRCPKCGLVADRDLNSALNIFHRSGQDRRALTLVR